MNVITYLLWIILATIIIIGVWITMDMLLNKANGQEVKAPPAVLPTPVPTPTPTSPDPNLQYLPQKAYVQAYAPENGIPSNGVPLQVVPQVVPQQAAQNNTLGIPTDIVGYLALAGAGFTYFKTHILGKKTEKVEEVTREQSAQIVKGASVDESLARQVYENMPDKGNSINDKPEIQLKSLADNQAEAVKTATKS